MRSMMVDPEVARVLAWLVNARALPGRASLLARDKTIIAVVGVADLSAIDLGNAIWRNAPATAMRWRDREEPSLDGRSIALEQILSGWRATLESVMRRAILDTEPVFPVLQPRRSDEPQRPMDQQALLHVIRKRLRGIGLPEKSCGVRPLRGCLIATLIGRDGNLATWPMELAPIRSADPVIVLPGKHH